MANVRLIAASTGAKELHDQSAENIIVYAARVSNPQNQNNFQSGAGLLKYCLKNSHFSIFETASMTVEIKTSRAIADQLLRHKSFNFQMMSSRYAECTDRVSVDARRQDQKNRQNSIPDLGSDVQQWFAEAQKSAWDLSYSLYKEALSKGIAKECARFLLPLSTSTTLYMTGNFRSWYHYIELRSSNGTQLEHAEIAKEIKNIIVHEFPILGAAFNWEARDEQCQL